MKNHLLQIALVLGFISSVSSGAHACYPGQIEYLCKTSEPLCPKGASGCFNDQAAANTFCQRTCGSDAIPN